jgi:hypothetical protein
LRPLIAEVTSQPPAVTAPNVVARVEKIASKAVL